VWLSAPGVKRFGTATTQLNLDDTTVHPDSNSEIESWGGGFDMRLGFGVPRDLLPGWQIEFGASYAELNEHSRGTFRLAEFPDVPFGEMQFLQATPIDGSLPASLLIAGPGQEVQSSFDADIQLYELRLQLARPIEILSGVKTKLRAGLMGGEFDEDYVIDQTLVNDSFFPAAPGFISSVGFNELNEEAESWFIGPVFGVALEAEVAEKIHTFVELEIALLAHHANLDAHQRVRGTALAPDPCTQPDCTLSFGETDEETHFNARPRIEMGVEYDFGFARLGVTGAFTYWTYAPEVVNPRRPHDTSVFFDDGVAPARLSAGDMMSGEIGMRLMIPF
jgi:hypothetical protein